MKSLIASLGLILVASSPFVGCGHGNEPEVPTESAVNPAGSDQVNPVVENGAKTPETGDVAGNTTDVSKENPDATSQDLPNGASPGPSPTNDTANLPAEPSGGAPTPAPAPDQPASPPAQSQNPVPSPAPAPEGTPAPSPGPAPAPAPVFAANCAEVKKTQAGAKTGISQIFLNPNDDANRKAIDAFCDQDEDGGGWTLAMNYVHKGGTNPALSVKSNSLPVVSSSTLGTDESAVGKSWGHAGNALMQNFDIKELRFFCRSSKQLNVFLNFKTNDAACISYVKTGQGSCSNIKNAFTKLTGHNATIPALADKFASNQGNNAMTNDMFARELTGNPDPLDPTWSVKGGGKGESWECDFGSNDFANDTIHRIFFR